MGEHTRMEVRVTGRFGDPGEKDDEGRILGMCLITKRSIASTYCTYFRQKKINGKVTKVNLLGTV